MQFFSIKFKNIFQKIRHDKGISLSSIADKEKMVSFDKIGLYGSLEIFWVRPHLCHTFVAPMQLWASGCTERRFSLSYNANVCTKKQNIS